MFPHFIPYLNFPLLSPQSISDRAYSLFKMCWEHVINDIIAHFNILHKSLECARTRDRCSLYDTIRLVDINLHLLVGSHGCSPQE